eukprot:g78569.t1
MEHICSRSCGSIQLGLPALIAFMDQKNLLSDYSSCPKHHAIDIVRNNPVDDPYSSKQVQHQIRRAPVELARPAPQEFWAAWAEKVHRQKQPLDLASWTGLPS